MKSSKSAGLRFLGDRLGGVDRVIALLVAAGALSLLHPVRDAALHPAVQAPRWGQFIRDDGPQTHHTKRGTPTMGGIVFILGAIVGYLIGHLLAGVPGRWSPCSCSA